MKKVKLRDSDLHPHLRSRMEQRGVTEHEIETTLNRGWKAEDAKSGTSGKTYVFSYKDHWEDEYFEEKEVSLYYKFVDKELILLTVTARYGKDFPRKSVK